MARFVTKTAMVTTTHTTFVAAPPRAVYRLVAEASRWPYLFAPVVHVERLAATGLDARVAADAGDRAGTEDRLRLWAVNNGAVRNWVSRRGLDCDELRIRFQHEAPAPPVASMAGEWVFVPLPGNATSVVLLHEFRALDDDPGNTALIKQAVDRNSTAELAALKRVAELGDRLARVVHTFTDSVQVDAPLPVVYQFLHRAQDWPARMPQLSRLVLDEAVPNVQTLELDVTASDGGLSTTRQVRICFPCQTIAYKEIEPPELVAAAVGRGVLRPTTTGIRVTSHSTLLMQPERAAELHGLPGTVDRAGEQVRQRMRAGSLAVLAHLEHATAGAAVGAGLDPG
jgi:hypothetical protein